MASSRDRIREIVSAQLSELHARRTGVLDQIDLDRLETLSKISAVADKLEEVAEDGPEAGNDELERRLAAGRA